MIRVTTLVEVRLSKSLRNGPPIVARALAIVHTCMYDAGAAYDGDAVGTTDTSGSRRLYTEGQRTDANKAKAISFAAYRCILNLYPDGTANVPPPPTPSTTSARLGVVLQKQLAYDVSEMSE